MPEQRTCPHGVTCGVDSEQTDPDAACRFSGGLFGWTLAEATPLTAGGSSRVATLDGASVAGPGDARLTGRASAGSMDAGTMIGVPGHGAHLAVTVDPGILERQATAPPGFADVVGSLAVVGAGEPTRWHVTGTVADRDDSVARAERLGATVVRSAEDAWTRNAVVRDPQGAELSVSQFTLPDGW